MAGNNEESQEELLNDTPDNMEAAVPVKKMADTSEDAKSEGLI